MVLILYTIIALIANIQDIRTREVSNLVHIFIILLALPNLTADKALGAVIALIIFALPNFFKTESIGGADIKFMFASALLLGAEKIIIATIIGMIVAIICANFRRLILKHKFKSIALIPYLSVGCLFACLI